MAEVKQWITIKGRHIPIMEGETKADAIKRLKEGAKKGKENRPISKEGFKKEVEKHNDFVTKEKDSVKQKESTKKLLKKHREQIKNVKFEKKGKLEPKKEEKEIDKNSVEYRTQRVKDALKYAKEKIDKQSYSWKETVMDAQYEYDISRYDIPHLEKAMKLYAMKKGKFQDHYEEWDKEFRKQGVNVDTLLNKDKKLEKVHEAEDLLKDYMGYELPKDLISKKNYLNLKRDDYEANKAAWSQAYSDLEKARDKYINPEYLEIMSRREARFLVNDSEHPEIMEIKQKSDRAYKDMKEYEKIRDEYWEATEKLDKKQSIKEKSDYGLPDFKEAVGDYIGFKSNDTGTSYYNDQLEQGKAHVVEMTPEEYIKECAYYVFENSTLEKTLRGRVGDEDTEKYAKMMREGTKFYTPYLNYKDYAQEGLHRAVAAYMNGIKKIPVVVVGSRR